MPRVLVTGATGFIGGHLVASLLGRGDEVRCLVRQGSNTEWLRQRDVELVVSPFGDADGLAAACADRDVVYHLAGKISARRCEDLYRVNGEYVRLLVEALGKGNATPPLLLLVSSVAAAGPIPKGQVRVESDAPAPISDYGRSKRAGEQEAEKWAEHGPVTIVRPGIVFGPRDRTTLPMFQTIRRFRIHPMAGFVVPPLSLIHVDDLVQLILLAADKGRRIAPSHDNAENRGLGVYFATANEYPDYAQLGRMIRSTLRRPFAPNVPLPAAAAMLMASGNEWLARLRGRPASFNRDKIVEATASSWACCAEAAQQDFSFQVKKPLQQAIQETSDWYLKNGWL